MLNVKDQVNGALCKVIDNVTDGYPKNWAKMPAIQYQEEDNRVVEHTDMEEQKAYCRYKIDIWNDESTSALAVEVDRAIAALGLKRTQCMDVDDPNGYKHKLMRYEMVIDVNTQEVYHND